MKILFISHKFFPDIGGIEVNSEILALAFHNAGEDVRLLTWTQRKGEKAFPFPVIRSPNLVTLVKQFLWTDVIFENNPSLRLSWPALVLKKPSVVALRTWLTRLDGTLGWQDRLKHYRLSRASGVIAVSEAVRKRCWGSAIVIGNPYREKLFRIIPGISRDVEFAFLGRLVSDKGADMAIRAINSLLESRKSANLNTANIRLTIIGNGPEKLKLQSLAREFGIDDRIEFAGSLQGEALVRCLNKHKFLLVPSVWEEPFGNVALEGLACGCLPIVSDGGGLGDAVGQAGLTFKRGNVTDLVDTITRVIDNRSLEQTIRSSAAKHLTAHHPDVVSKRYLKVIYDSVGK